MAEVIFRKLAREWWERHMLTGSAVYAEESWERLEREVFPDLGDRDVKKIKAPAILKILRRIEERGTYEVARKVRSHVSQTLRYGIACGLILTNPARDLGFALKPKKHQPRAAIMEPRQIGQLMRDIGAFPAKQRRCALQLAALTFVRPGELCKGEWGEIEMDTGIWRIPARKMKMKRPHIVPLSRQAQDVIRDLRGLTGGGNWLFPSPKDRTRPMQGRVLSRTLRRIGYGPEAMSAHGFRAMAASTLSEQGWPSEVIERQLAHVDRNQVRAAYQRSELLTERRNMMQAWADYLDMRHAQAILGR
ncbi:Phage integrase family protein (fragment) [uncultured delta proteobacterium]|uniref:Phage integrase family protein n=1 Tax=uncultured delta proteobacterium TaxID=34034 RepID=A0A212J7N7_9DELT